MSRFYHRQTVFISSGIRRSRPQMWLTGLFKIPSVWRQSLPFLSRSVGPRTSTPSHFIMRHLIYLWEIADAFSATPEFFLSCWNLPLQADWVFTERGLKYRLLYRDCSRREVHGILWWKFHLWEGHIYSSWFYKTITVSMTPIKRTQLFRVQRKMRYVSKSLWNWTVLYIYIPIISFSASPELWKEFKPGLTPSYWVTRYRRSNRCSRGYFSGRCDSYPLAVEIRTSLLRFPF